MNVMDKGLRDILEAHLHWIKEDIDGWENMRADLSDEDLFGVDLSGADIRGAKISGADLSGALLYDAKLNDAKLNDTKLNDTDLSGADLRGANLSGADLRGANLSGADLSGADLSGADLCGAKLSGAKNVPFIPLACPDTGSFIGWKKACVDKEKLRCLISYVPVIVKLLIPEDAKRSSATRRKCRCDKAVVLAIEPIRGDDTTCETKIAYSKYDTSFTYEVGKTVSVEDFDDDRFKECAPGIHFFVNRQEAVDYMF